MLAHDHATFAHLADFYYSEPGFFVVLFARVLQRETARDAGQTTGY